MHSAARSLVLLCLIATLAWAQARSQEGSPVAPAPVAVAPVSEETSRAARFFAAQERLRRSDTKIKRAADDARAAREAAHTKSVAGAALRRQGPPRSLDERKTQAEAREAEIDAEVRAEMAQTALEEAELDQIAKDDSSLAELVAARRQELVARKKMLAIRANNAGRLEMDAEEMAKRQPPAAGEGKGSK